MTTTDGISPTFYILAVHTIGILALDDVIPFDLATPAEVFGRARLPDGRPAYRVRVGAPTPEVDAGLFTLRPPWNLADLLDVDTLIVPGRANPFLPTPPAALDMLRTAAEHGTRIASICVGAFTVAESGLLDGLRATTHWSAADELSRRHPAIDVDPSVLFVDNGRVLTSAGAAAGLDLCLHMIRKDYGSAVAADVARVSVMPLERDGGQAQFIVHEPPASHGSSLAPLLVWLDEHCGRPLSLDDIATRAGMSTRTLHRRFRDQTGTTPLRWLQHARLRRAQGLLETTDHGIDRIAQQVGYGSTTNFREHFQRLVGTSPRTYRRSFGSPQSVAHPPTRNPEDRR
jgi:transcriptional regulator GlxA family with amidase domain